MKHFQPHLWGPANDIGSRQRFCPNCGHPVNPEDVFCQHCGYRLKATTSPQPTPPTHPLDSSTTASKPSRPARQPLSRRAKWFWGTGLTLLVILIGLVVYGNHYFSREATLQRTIDAIRTDQNLTRQFRTTDSHLTLSTATLKPLARYYGNHPKALSQLQSSLLASGTSADGHLSFGQQGHTWLIFPKYQITVTPVRPTVTTNHTGNVITLDGHKVATATTDDFSTRLPALVPGQYDLTAAGTIGGHHLKNQGTYHIATDSTYDLELKTISVTFNTTPGAVIFLNNKKLGMADGDGSFELKDEPWSDALTVFAKYSTDSGSASTNPVKLSKDDDQSTIDLPFEGLISQSDADTLFSSLFSTVEEMSNHGVEDGDGLSDYFYNGSANAEYADLTKMADGYYHNDDITGTTMTADIKDVAPSGHQMSLVTFTVKYDFGLSDYDYDHVQVFQYTATVKPSTNQSDNYQIVKMSGAQKVSDYHDN